MEVSKPVTVPTLVPIFPSIVELLTLLIARAEVKIEKFDAEPKEVVHCAKAEDDIIEIIIPILSFLMMDFFINFDFFGIRIIAIIDTNYYNPLGFWDQIINEQKSILIIVKSYMNKPRNCIIHVIIKKPLEKSRGC